MSLHILEQEEQGRSMKAWIRDIRFGVNLVVCSLLSKSDDTRHFIRVGVYEDGTTYPVAGPLSISVSISNSAEARQGRRDAL